MKLRPKMYLCLGCCIWLLLVSCSGPKDLLEPDSYPLSDADIQAIKLLVAGRSDIKKPIYRITGFSASRAEVYSGRDEGVGDVRDDFTVRKRDGQWIVASSINEERIIVTAD